MAKFGPQEDAWAMICPETEAERHECNEMNQVVADNEDDCRTRTNGTVIKYPRFNSVKCSEKYYHSILQLLLPHRVDIKHFKPASFETFEDFYLTGNVK